MRPKIFGPPKWGHLRYVLGDAQPAQRQAAFTLRDFDERSLPLPSPRPPRRGALFVEEFFRVLKRDGFRFKLLAE